MMQQHNDPFFAQVQQKLYNLEVTPPANAYAGIQSKLTSGGAASRWWLNTAMLTLATGIVISALVGTRYHYATAEAELVQTEVAPLQAVLEVSQARILDREYDLKFEELAIVQEEELVVMAAARERMKQPNTVRRTTAVATNISDRSEVILTPAATEATIQTEVASEVLAVPAEIPNQILPSDWAKRMETVKASEILDQVEDENEDIIITIPVKVTVGDED